MTPAQIEEAARSVVDACYTYSTREFNQSCASELIKFWYPGCTNAPPDFCRDQLDAAIQRILGMQGYSGPVFSRVQPQQKDPSGSSLPPVPPFSRTPSGDPEAPPVKQDEGMGTGTMVVLGLAVVGGALVAWKVWR